jgi:Transposase DDE domain
VYREWPAPSHAATARGHETLETAREREAQLAFSKEYQQRAGIEGTISAGARVLHLRRSRYVGLTKTHLQQVLTAAAMDLIRLDAWLSGTPLARTRQIAFTRLMTLPMGAWGIRQQYLRRRKPTVRPMRSKSSPRQPRRP